MFHPMHGNRKTALKSQETRVPAGYAMKYRKQKEAESIEQYAFELERLALDAYPNEQNIRENRNLIECFISGIRNDELAIKLLQDNFDNLADAVNVAKQYFTALQTRRFLKTESDYRPQLEKVYNIQADDKAQSQVNVVTGTVNKQQHMLNITPAINAQGTTSTGYVTQYNPGVQQYPQPNYQFQQPMTGWPNPPYNQRQYYQQYPQFTNPNQYSQPPVAQYQPNRRVQGFTTRSPGRRNRSNIICYFCQKPGHYKNECYSYLRTMGQNQQQQTGNPLCTYCGKSGHRAENCWHLQSKQPGETTQNISKNPFRPT